jgi:formylglycine-generating enzyme required for sulfatase activity
MLYRSIFLIFFFLLSSDVSFSKWLEISNLQVKKEITDQGGAKIIIEYDINDPEISSDSPAYVFIRFSKDSGKEWYLLPMQYFRGDGYDIVDSPGHKQVIWWGPTEMSFSNLDKLKFKVRAMKMIKIPNGEFIMKAVPGAGYDGSKSQNRVSGLPTFYVAKYETTIAMYVDYLNEVGGDGTGWNKRMSDNLRCGITQNGASPNFTYSVIPGREKFPITYVSWYDAVAFLEWCGLRLPIEAEWEKAFRGGIFLDGDEKKQKSNPLSERKYPWGNEAPNEGGIYRCNYDGADDGFENSAPVGSFEKFNSPNCVSDMAGNVAEWTLDWYTTTYHIGIDGFRVVRGGSWMAVPVECDAITGATSIPLKESSIMGFRGAK